MLLTLTIPTSGVEETRLEFFIILACTSYCKVITQINWRHFCYQIWNILELIVQSSKRYDQYNRYTLAYYEKINSTDDYSDPRMNDDYYFQKSYKLSALTGKLICNYIKTK